MPVTGAASVINPLPLRTTVEEAGEDGVAWELSFDDDVVRWAWLLL
jgi:hypothetical protein